MAAFALAAGRLASDWPLARMRRLQQDLVPLSSDSPTQSVAWSALGEQRVATGGDRQVWLHVQAQTALGLCCQRCLQPMTVELDVRSAFLFVQSEELAEQLDEHCEDNVLAIAPSLDLLSLIEDELILALPLVPRHDVCPVLFPMSAGSDELSDAKALEHPFAGLAPLLRRTSGDG